MAPIVFKIYLAGHSAKTSSVEETLDQLCKEILGSAGYSIKVIDVEANPKIADRKKILATPTIIKESPKPEKRIIGDLNNYEKAKKAIEYLIKNKSK